MLSLLIFILILSVLIVVHEFGHFLVAKRNGVRVETFSIGFGPIIFRRKGKETEFTICLFPLGGYVKLAGDNRAEAKGHADEFLSKSPGVKTKIVLAGPVSNYLFAFILFWIIAIIGFPYPAAVVGGVLEDYPAAQAGIKVGDRILEVNGEAVDNWTQMTSIIQSTQDDVTLDIEREGKQFQVTVPLKQREITDAFGRKRPAPIVGITASSEVKIVQYNFFAAFGKSVTTLFSLTFMIIKGFAFMIIGIVPFKEAMAGPLGIYYITSEAIKVGIVAILYLMAILNVSLTIVNLLPLPVLDGGHLVIFTLEKIRRKALSQKVEDFLTKTGVVIIALIIMFVFYNDIRRFGSQMWGAKSKEIDIETIEKLDE